MANKISQELADQYEKAVGKKVFYGWSEKEVKEKIAEAESADKKTDTVADKKSSKKNKKSSKKKGKKLKKVKFIKSPTGAYNLGYHINDEGTFDSDQADEMIETGYAEEI